MKIKIHSSELNRMMKTIAQCIDQRIPKYSNIEILHGDNLLKICGTNGTFQAEMSTPLMGGDGERFCVDGTMFAKVCAMCSGEIEIRTEGRQCTVKGAGRTRLPIVDAEVSRPEHIEGKFSVISAGELARCYSGVSYAISTDQARTQLTGAYCQFGEYGMKMVALDGFQMSIDTGKCSGDVMNVIVPGAFMKLIVQGTVPDEDVTVRVNSNRIEAATDGMVLTCGLLTGEYPDYQKILPKAFKTGCIVKADELRNALKSGSVISGKQNLVKLEIGTESIRVMSNSEEADYDADVPCETRGDGLKIAFNQRYLMNTIGAIADEYVILRFNGSTAPCVAEGKDTKGIRLLLPVRVMGE